MTRLVNCAKLGRELPGMDRAPFPGVLGQKIFDSISQEAWKLWEEHQTLLINHNGLTMANPEAMDALIEEMQRYLFEDRVALPDDWVPEGQGTGAGVPGLGGAPEAGGDKGAPAKGAPTKGAPQRK